MFKQAMIAVAEAHPSPTNPRKHYDETKLAELTASVVTKGILQPLLVRPVKTPRGEYEVVCGERRRRAAVAAKLKEIPVTIRDLDDAEALELQLIENGAREDVHPLEEADGYNRLQEYGRTVEAMAAKVGKSKSYIYQRLRLCNLSEKCRKAFSEGKIEVVVAMLLARIARAEVQDRAYDDLSKHTEDGYVVLVSDARDLIRDRYMLELSSAPFSLSDAKLLPAAGACSACPKRSGAQRDLFDGDQPKSDSCLDSACFEAKSDAAWAAEAKRAEEGGGKVLSQAETKKVFPYGLGNVSSSSGYLDLSATCYDDPKRRTYKQLVGAKAKELTVMARDQSGGVHQLVRKADVVSYIQAAHKDVAKNIVSEGRRDDIAKAAQKKRQVDGERRNRLAQAVIGAVVEASVKQGVGAEGWKILAALVVRHAHHEAGTRVCRARGWKLDKPRPDLMLGKQLSGLGQAQLPGLVLELLLSEFSYQSYTDKLDKDLEAAAKVYGVSVAAMKKRLSSEDKVKKATSRAPKQKKRRG